MIKIEISKQGTLRVFMNDSMLLSVPATSDMREALRFYTAPENWVKKGKGNGMSKVDLDGGWRMEDGGWRMEGEGSFDKGGMKNG